MKTGLQRGLIGPPALVVRLRFSERKIGLKRRIYWLALLLLSACLLQPIWAQTNLGGASSASTLAKPIMHSRIFQWSDMKGRPSNVGTFRDGFDAPTATLERFSCHVTTLNPGKEPHPAHRHPEEELLVIKDGTLEVVQSGVTNQVSAGGMVFCASNELHGWRNSTKNPVTYYVLKVYPHDLAKTAQTNSPIRAATSSP